MTIRNTPIGPGSKIQNITEEQARRQETSSTKPAPSSSPRTGAAQLAEDVQSLAQETLVRQKSKRDQESKSAQKFDFPGPERSRKRLLLVPFVALLLLGAVALFHTKKPMPRGTSIASEPAMARVTPLIDLAYHANGKQVHQQEIFDRLFRLIAEAEDFLILDMFLFNNLAGGSEPPFRTLSADLTRALLDVKARKPSLPVVFVTDPINIIYGGQTAPHLEQLEAAGIEVVFTNLEELRDSNPSYSAFWRLFLSWTGNNSKAETLPNPFDPGDKLSLRSYLHMANFKANHRKVAITRTPEGIPIALVSSANPHDGSAGHSNLAFLVEGPPAAVLARSELDVANFSGLPTQGEILKLLAEPASVVSDAEHPRPVVETQLLTEGAIGRAIVADLESLEAGDAVAAALFYVSWRPFIEALIDAANRGVDVRLILDANRDAFGREKKGVPNRPVAHELRVRTSEAAQVRWFNTHGEQFHTKALLLRRGRELLVHAGSANITRRNIGDLNMEANIRLRAGTDSPVAASLLDYFTRLWTNRDAEFTLPYEDFEDAQIASYWKYRFGESTGLSTF